MDIIIMTTLNDNVLTTNEDEATLKRFQVWAEFREKYKEYYDNDDINEYTSEKFNQIQHDCWIKAKRYIIEMECLKYLQAQQDIISDGILDLSPPSYMEILTFNRQNSK